jgi:hypothetical protein
MSFYLSLNDQKPALPILPQIPIRSLPSSLSFSLPTCPLTHLSYVRNPYRKLHRLPFTNPSFPLHLLIYHLYHLPNFSLVNFPFSTSNLVGLPVGQPVVWEASREITYTKTDYRKFFSSFQNHISQRGL